MFRVFWEERWCMAAMLLFFVISIANRLFLGIAYENLIREAENMAVTRNATLKRWKTKFIKCFQLNGGVNNVPIFVEKCMSHLAVGNFSFEKLDHYSGQALLFSIVMAGIGICRFLADGKSIGQVIPFYLACFVELYLYFSISAVVNIKEKQRILKIYLVDYLENHLSARIGTTQGDLEILGYVAPGENFTEKHPMKMRMMEGRENSCQTREKKEQGSENPCQTMEKKTQESEEQDEMDIAKATNVMEHSGRVRALAKEDETSVMQEEWEELIREIMTV